jgi:FkbM family methyltransferase
MLTKIKDFEFEVEDEPADYWGWVREGRYDHEWAIYDKYLKPEHTFVDLGAWVGAHSLYASEIAKRVVAVEPDPVAFPIVEKNLRGIRGTDVRRIAIRAEHGEILLGSGYLGASTTRANRNAGNGIGEWDAEHTCIAKCITLRELCEFLPDPLFIKIDVEGSEETILRDLDFFRERKPRVLIELHPWWWYNEGETMKNFEAVRKLYDHSEPVPHPGSNTWILA